MPATDDGEDVFGVELEVKTVKELLALVEGSYRNLLPVERVAEDLDATEASIVFMVRGISL